MDEKQRQTELNALDAEVLQERQASDAAFLALLEAYRIKAASEYAEKDYLLERDGIGFSPRGNVMALSAEKKAGKTWFAMAMCAAFLKGTDGIYLGMRSRMDGGRVVYFDTEQDEVDGQRIQRRVHFANGWDFTTDNDRFQIFHLREINAKERREFVCKVIEYMKPDLVIVDGIRDLLTDFNDLEQSASVIQDFMRLSSECKCAIWAVLHVNPNSEKMRGHLGTELGNKVADILHMTKDKNPKDEDDVTYKMEEVAARSHKDIHSIVFRIDDSKPYGAPVIVGDEELTAMEDDAKAELYEKMLSIIGDPGSVTTRELLAGIKDKYGVGTTKAYKIIDEAVNCNVINKHGYRFNMMPKPKRKDDDLGAFA